MPSWSRRVLATLTLVAGAVLLIMFSAGGSVGPASASPLVEELMFLVERNSVVGQAKSGKYKMYEWNLDGSGRSELALAKSTASRLYVDPIEHLFVIYYSGKLEVRSAYTMDIIKTVDIGFYSWNEKVSKFDSTITAVGYENDGRMFADHWYGPDFATHYRVIANREADLTGGIYDLGDGTGLIIDYSKRPDSPVIVSMDDLSEIKVLTPFCDIDLFVVDPKLRKIAYTCKNLTELRVMNVDDGKIESVPFVGQPHAFSKPNPQGKLAVASGNYLYKFDLVSVRISKEIILPKFSNYVKTVAISPDGRQIVAGIYQSKPGSNPGFRLALFQSGVFARWLK